MEPVALNPVQSVTFSNRDAVFVTDTVQVEFLKANANASFENCWLLPLSTQAYGSALSWRQDRVRSYFEFVDFAGCKRQYHDQALRQSKTWLKQLGLSVEVKGIDLAELDHVCQFLFFTQAAYLEETAARLIRASPEIDTFYVVASKHSLPLDFYFDSDVPAAILRFVCEKLGRSVRVLEMSERPRLLHPGFPRRPVNNFADSRPLSPLPSPSSRRVGFVPATVSHYHQVLEALRELSCQIVTFQSAWGNIPNLDTAASKAREYCVHLSSAGGDWSDKVASQLAKLLTQIQQRSRRSNLPSSIIQNPHLDFQIRYIIQKRWLSYANMIHHAARLVKGLPLELFIYADHFTAEGAILSHLYRRAGTQILVAPHSNWPCDPNWASWRRSDTAFTHSKMAAAKLRELSGISKILPAAKPVSPTYRSVLRAPPAGSLLAEKRRIAGDRKIVVLVSNALELACFPHTGLDRYFETMAALGQVPDRLRDRVMPAIRTKSQPLGEDPILYRSLCGFSSESIAFLQGLTFSECVDLADCIVCMNIPTGGCFEILEKGVPLIHLYTAEVMSLQPDIPADAVTRVTEPGAIWSEIEAVLFDESHRQATLARQRRFIGSEYGQPLAVLFQKLLRPPRSSGPSAVDSDVPPNRSLLSLRRQGAAGYIDDVLVGTNGMGLAAGWAADLVVGKPATAIHVFLGDRWIGKTCPSDPRPDVAAALGEPGLERAGFSAPFPVESTFEVRQLHVYAELHDGAFFEVTMLA